MASSVWWYLRHGRRSFEMQERNWQEVLRVNAQLAQLLVEHHAVGVLDGALLGERCPVCVRAGIVYPEHLA